MSIMVMDQLNLKMERYRAKERLGMHLLL